MRNGASAWEQKGGLVEETLRVRRERGMAVWTKRRTRVRDLVLIEIRIGQGSFPHPHPHLARKDFSDSGLCGSRLLSVFRGLAMVLKEECTKLEVRTREVR